jgi:hypothetical protein
MGSTGTVIEPVKVKPAIDLDTLVALNPALANDSYVYVHCNFRNRWRGMLIRIWSTTYLIDQATGAKSRLVHAENITLAPVWTMVPDRRDYSFLLIFEALPQSCKVFELLEDIPQAGGFHVGAILRNPSDVYHVDLT